MNILQTIRLRTRSRPIAIVALLIALAIIGVSIWWLFFYSSRGDGDWQDERGATAVDGSESLPEIPEPIFKELTPEEAIEENETIPFSDATVEAALPLVFPANASAIAGQRTATDCLTAAVYYEGATEPLEGRRGIAQVILNRARHPAFPNTVCGVVYQGSERRTGCQFTFTCDGSLGRRPSRRGWDAARQVATGALAGAVEPKVGMATHYHADYVVPYWASSLDKIVKVGAHIFYRWKGGWGRRAAFRQKVVADDTVMIEPDLTNLIDGEMDNGLFGDPILSEPASAVPAGPAPLIDRRIGELPPARALPNDRDNAAEPFIKPGLKADRKKGSLAVDEKAGSLKSD